MFSMTDLRKELLRDLTQRCRQGRAEGRRRAAAGAGVGEPSLDLQGFVSGSFSSGRARQGQRAQTGTSPQAGPAGHT